MNKRKILLLAVTVVAPAGVLLTGQQASNAGIFTAAQAEAGRASYADTCARCHTYSLRGRKGDEGELPPVSTLSVADQKFIGNPNHVPAFVGEVFLSHFGDKTAAQLIARFDTTARDPGFHFKNVDDNTAVNITAYVLQMNGAKPGDEPFHRENFARYSRRIENSPSDQPSPEPTLADPSNCRLSVRSRDSFRVSAEGP